MSQRVDRRKFLVGAGGAMLALPMLEAFAERKAYADLPAPPKRVLFLFHPHGRPAGKGYDGEDNWSPGAAGPLPANISPALAALAPIRDKIVTLDGIDNIVRAAAYGDTAGHGAPGATCMTCAVPISNGPDDSTATSHSIDYELGLRLRANDTLPPSMIFPATSAGATYMGYWFWGPGGSPPFLVDSRPEVAIPQIFGPAQPAEPPPTPTLHDRLVGRRASILDGVAKSFFALRSKLNAADRDRLDAHAAFVEKLEKNVGGGGVVQATESCVRPDENAVPDYSGSNNRGQKDGITMPFQLENVVQALACDITRVAAFEFHNGYDPVFPTEFPNGGQIVNGNWHDMLHNAPQISDPNTPDLTKAYQCFGKNFTSLVQRLDQMLDLDGKPMLESTLLVWVSDMGYGAAHYDWNIPVVLAGMPSAFPKGQGRHVVMNRRTLGDLYAQILRMVGETDMTFGATGTLGSVSASQFADSAYDFGNGIGPSTPLHMGTIDL